MSKLTRNLKTYPLRSAAIASALVWGLVEFVALQRAQVREGSQN